MTGPVTRLACILSQFGPKYNGPCIAEVSDPGRLSAELQGTIGRSDVVQLAKPGDHWVRTGSRLVHHFFHLSEIWFR